MAARLEVKLSNPGDTEVDTLAVVPVKDAARVAPHFPGATAVAVTPSPLALLPSQADDLDGDGAPDEFVFPVHLKPHASLIVHLYYSQTLTRVVPWPQQVSASHSFGYNRATAALESAKIGYRTYGGLFLDVQARAAGSPGLFNEIVGLASPSLAPGLAIGRDILHIGDTLGLGGLFLRSGSDVYRPPVNVPDYAHKPENPEAPVYRVISSGPIRAVIEARIDHWTIGSDAVLVRALYSIAANSEAVTCRFEILPLHLTRTYEVGSGVLHLPKGRVSATVGRILVTGEQNPAIGPLGLATAYSTAAASPAGVLETSEGASESFVFHQRLEPGIAIIGSYQLAGAWSGSGITVLDRHLAEVLDESQRQIRIDGYTLSFTPKPDQIEGEPR
jgi:hypothetical protein